MPGPRTSPALTDTMLSIRSMDRAQAAFSVSVLAKAYQSCEPEKAEMLCLEV